MWLHLLVLRLCLYVFVCRASSLCGNDCVDRESLSSFHLKLKRKHKTGNVLEAVSCFIKTNVSRGNLRAKTAKEWVSRAEELKAVRSQVLVSLDCYKLVDRKDFVLRLSASWGCCSGGLHGGAGAGRALHGPAVHVLRDGLRYLHKRRCAREPSGDVCLGCRVYAAAAARLAKYEGPGAFTVKECGIVMNAGTSAADRLPVVAVEADPDFPTDGFAAYLPATPPSSAHSTKALWRRALREKGLWRASSMRSCCLLPVCTTRSRACLSPR